MSENYRTALSTHDAESITVRGKDLPSEIMGEMDFGSAFYFLLTGEEPTAPPVGNCHRSRPVAPSSV
jgi:hypothetical protein